MSSMAGGNPKVTVEVFRLGPEKVCLGTLETTYEELDQVGNHGATPPVLDGTPGFAFPSSVAFAIWARINGQATGGHVTQDAGIWYGYDWQIVGNAA